MSSVTTTGATYRILRVSPCWRSRKVAPSCAYICSISQGSPRSDCPAGPPGPSAPDRTGPPEIRFFRSRSSAHQMPPHAVPKGPAARLHLPDLSGDSQLSPA